MPEDTTLISLPKLCKRWNIGERSLVNLETTGKIRRLKFDRVARFPMSQVLRLEAEWAAPISISPAEPAQTQRKGGGG